MDSGLTKAGAVNRVTKEYTVRDKVRNVCDSSLHDSSSSISFDP